MNEQSAITRLVGEFSKLPGIGRKTAERLAYHILKEDDSFGQNLARAITEVKEKIVFCSICGNMTEEDPCRICENHHRNRKLICVVEEAKDIWSIEKIGTYNGVYHVLMGALSPLDGIGPEKLRIQELLQRVQGEQAEEVIVATNPNVEGDATALYLSRLLKPLGVTVTRIASGLPVGGDLEYADSVTLSKALMGRRPL
ncbi:MAG: recombination protein RecR [Spirochaetes bacterium]|nr:recombination protein RecR [Spirochaetota bacterium]